MSPQLELLVVLLFGLGLFAFEAGWGRRQRKYTLEPYLPAQRKWLELCRVDDAVVRSKPGVFFTGEPPRLLLLRARSVSRTASDPHGWLDTWDHALVDPELLLEAKPRGIDKLPPHFETGDPELDSLLLVLGDPLRVAAALDPATRHCLLEVLVGKLEQCPGLVGLAQSFSFRRTSDEHRGGAPTQRTSRPAPRRTAAESGAAARPLCSRSGRDRAHRRSTTRQRSAPAIALSHASAPRHRRSHASSAVARARSRRLRA